MGGEKPLPNINKRWYKMTDPKWWDGTFFESQGWTMREVVDKARPICENFVIGKEIAPTTGAKHLQCRFCFKVGKELATIKNQFGCMQGHEASFSVTHVRNFDYCEKEGAFYRSWEEALGKYIDIELYPWQEQAEYELLAQGERGISVIVDPRGKHGKTYLTKHLEACHKADACPVSSGEAQDYIEYCFNHPAKAYIFDIPRSDTIRGKTNMWKAVEQIKNGLLYDRRYTSRKKWIDPPAILIFANEEPPYEALSEDRWRVWTIDDDWPKGQLMPIAHEG